METRTRVSLAYKGLKEIPREYLTRFREMQVTELDLSHNELTYPFTTVKSVATRHLWTVWWNLSLSSRGQNINIFLYRLWACDILVAFQGGKPQSKLLCIYGRLNQNAGCELTSMSQKDFTCWYKISLMPLNFWLPVVHWSWKLLCHGIDNVYLWRLVYILSCHRNKSLYLYPKVYKSLASTMLHACMYMER